MRLTATMATLLTAAAATPALAQSSPPLAVVPVEDNVLDIPPAVYPRLPARFATAEAALPANWRLEHRVDGDLNRDGRSDIVLVLRQNDPANRIANPGLGPNPFDTNPRMLSVGLADGDGYWLAAQDFAFIPRNVTPTMDDPLLDAPTIDNGVLSIRLTLFLSAGGWTTWNTESKFRFQDGALRLIGQEYVRVQRNSGEMITRSANLLTRRIETVETRIDQEGTPPPAVVTRSPYRTPPTLAEVGDGLQFDPTGRADR